MLREVLHRFQNQTAPVSVAQMAREMDTTPEMLRTMIDYWIRKGKLRVANCDQETCNTCGAKSGCPFIVHLPVYYEVVEAD